MSRLPYFKIKDFEQQMEKLRTLKRGSLEYMRQYNKMFFSYGSDVVLTRKGMNIGLLLYDKYKSGVKLSRDELMELYLIGIEASLIRGRKDSLVIANRVSDEVVRRYNPDLGYLENYLYAKLGGRGYLKTNKNMIENIGLFLQIYG